MATPRTRDINGSAGGMLLDSSSGAITGKIFTCVEVLEDDTVFSVLTNAAYSGTGHVALTSRTWKRGDRIWGVTSALTITSGVVMAHNRVK